MSVTADLVSSRAEAIAATCARCWEAANPPPPASALVLMDDWKWELSRQRGLEQQAAKLARAEGYLGALNDLQHAAHRELYARSGDPADLAAMLRHVT